MAQLIKPQIKWTEEKILLLKKEYPLGDKKLLANKLGIKYKTLKTAAERFNIKSLQDKNFYKLKPLYSEDLISYYWIGFIMADGQIDNKGQLIVALSIKDKNHLEKLSNFLDVKTHEYISNSSYGNFPYCRMSCQDVFYGKKILKKFGLNGKAKTYNPPKKLIFEDKQFLSFLLGFIDGDGTFSNYDNNCNMIRIELHSSWLNILKFFELELMKLGIINITTGINKRGFSYIKIYKHQNLKLLKEFGLRYNLPILDRKWKSININRILKRKTKDNILKLDNIF